MCTAWTLTTLTVLMLATAPFVAGASPAGPATQPTQAETLTNADVIELHNAGLGEDLIIQKIMTSTPDFDVSVEGLTKLKAAGVADSVISVMMDAVSGTVTPTLSVAAMSITELREVIEEAIDNEGWWEAETYISELLTLSPGDVEAFGWQEHVGHEKASLLSADAKTIQRAFVFAAGGKGHVQTMSALLEAGANVDGSHGRAQGDEDITALELAAIGTGATVRFLLEAGADPNVEVSDGITPLMLTAFYEDADLDVVWALVEAGADVNRRTRDGRTVLDLAVDDGHAEMAATLIQAGADVDARKRTVDGGTALFTAVGKIDIQTVRALLDGGADINARDKKGRSVLFSTAYIGAFQALTHSLDPTRPEMEANDRELLQLLLEAGADPNVRALDGETARSIANSNSEFLRLLDTVGASAGGMSAVRYSPSERAVPSVCPYTPAGHLASWAVSAVSGELGRRFGSQAGASVGGQFGLVGALVGSIVGGVAGEEGARKFTNDMLEASHLPAFSGTRQIFQHLEAVHISDSNVDRAVHALVQVHALDQAFVRSVSDALYRKAF